MKKGNEEFIKGTTSEGIEEAIRLYGLEKGEEQYYKLLGTANGINFAHCFDMGYKNKENFWDRVFAYQIIPNKEDRNALIIEKVTGEEYLTVKFYELS